jgi:hypothetical protein
MDSLEYDALVWVFVISSGGKTVGVGVKVGVN